MARKSARASGDQMTAIRSGAASSLTAQPELAEDLFVRDAFTAGERSAGAVQRRGRLRRDLFLFHWSQGQRARQRLHHHFEQTPHGVQLLGGQHIQQRVGLLAFLIQIRFHGFPS